VKTVTHLSWLLVNWHRPRARNDYMNRGITVTGFFNTSVYPPILYYGNDTYPTEPR
jgi:hypothetical protein